MTEGIDRQRSNKTAGGKDDLELAYSRTNSKSFSLAHDPLDYSICNNLKAVLSKKIKTYWRQKKRLCLEIFMPSLFMAFGIWVATINFTYRSDSRVLTPDLYPLRQKLLVNELTYDTGAGNIPSRILIENLPDYKNAFQVEYINDLPDVTFDGFAEKVYAYGQSEANNEPYLYGSYEIFQADNVL